MERIKCREKSTNFLFRILENSRQYRIISSSHTQTKLDISVNLSSISFFYFLLFAGALFLFSFYFALSSGTASSRGRSYQFPHKQEPKTFQHRKISIHEHSSSATKGEENLYPQNTFDNVFKRLFSSSSMVFGHFLFPINETLISNFAETLSTPSFAINKQTRARNNKSKLQFPRFITLEERADCFEYFNFIENFWEH